MWSSAGRDGDFFVRVAASAAVVLCVVSCTDGGPVLPDAAVVGNPDGSVRDVGSVDSIAGDAPSGELMDDGAAADGATVDSSMADVGMVADGPKVADGRATDSAGVPDSVGVPDGPIAYPRGVYALSPPDTPIEPSLLSNDGLVGVVIQARWNEVEPDKDRYVFDQIEARIQEAHEAGLGVVLTINGALKLTPQWVTEETIRAGGSTVSFLNTNANQVDYCEEIVSPTFWDETFLAQRVELIAELGLRYGSDARVVAISTNFANFLTDDWNVPRRTAFSCPNVSYTENQVEEWLAVGYSHANMMNAGRTILGAVATAFPRHQIKLPLGTTHEALEWDLGVAASDVALAEDIVAWAKSDPRLAGRLNIQAHNLSASRERFDELPANPAGLDAIYMLIGNAAPISGLQLLSGVIYACNDRCRLTGGVCPDPCDEVEIFRQVVDIALSYRPAYIEVWTGDGASQDPGVRQTIALTTSALQSGALELPAR